jgi:molybdopterin molybdotransferase
MISFEEALALVLANLPEARVESISYRSAPGRILAESLQAGSDVPPFNRAAMDGYAVRASDVARAPVELESAGSIRAGGGSPPVLRPGQAMAIMTGAPVPEGADAVQMVEHTQISPDGRRVVILKPVRQGENIAPLGSEAAAGDVVMEDGRLVGPAEMAVLATFGISQIRVWRRPRVALLVTGDELVEVEDTPRPDQIRNSNAYSLGAQLRLMNIEPDYLGIVRDDREELRARVSEGLERDVLIVTGGVSMGEYDFGKDVFRELGLEILFSKVAMKPGKPTVFARKGDKLVFGLPGNPVSTFISFENFVRPALGRLCGLRRPDLPRVRGELLRDMKQAPGRTAFLPAWAAMGPTGWTVAPLRWKGSADIIGFARANSAVIFPADRDSMAKGETVEAMLLPDFFARQR